MKIPCGDVVELETSLRILRRQHHALYPVYKLSIPPADQLVIPTSQEWLIRHIMEDPVIAPYRPDASYERRFWRRIVGVLEDVGVKEIQGESEGSGEIDVEIDERIYTHLSDLMVSGTATESGSLVDLPGQSFRTFIFDRPDEPNEHALTLLEEQMAIQGGSTGLRTWTASLHLGQIILSHPSILCSSHHTSLKGKSVVELGAGTGFLSILLAQLGARVSATDLGDDVEGGLEENEPVRQAPLRRLRHNVELNGMQSQISVSHLDWMDALKPEAERPEIWRDSCKESRTVVAADVIYDPDIVPALVKTIQVLIDTENDGPWGQAIIAATVRNRSTLDFFRSSCEEAGMSITLLNIPPCEQAEQIFWDSGIDQGSDVEIMRIHKSSTNC